MWVYRPTLSLSWRIRNRIRSRSRNVLIFRIRNKSFRFRNPFSISSRLIVLGSYFEIQKIFMADREILSCSKGLSVSVSSICELFSLLLTTSSSSSAPFMRWTSLCTTLNDGFAKGKIMFKCTRSQNLPYSKTIFKMKETITKIGHCFIIYFSNWEYFYCFGENFGVGWARFA